jgi:hypothetical protein
MMTTKFIHQVKMQSFLNFESHEWQPFRVNKLNRSKSIFYSTLSSKKFSSPDLLNTLKVKNATTMEELNERVREIKQTEAIAFVATR